MDPVDNPYAPGAGTRPPALVGRDREIESFRILLQRLGAGHADRSMLVTGLRGVGKTVLLTALEEVADELHWQFVHTEISRNHDPRERLGVLCERALRRISPPGLLRSSAQLAARVVRSFKLTINPADGSFTVGGADSEPGKADSGRLEDDLIDVFEALGLAAREHDTGIVFSLDELHVLSDGDLEAVIAAVHRGGQLELPITVVGAGLPHLMSRAVAAKPYSERLFTFPELGRLSDEDAARAITEPAQEYDLDFEDDAIHEILAQSEGYPYFVQLYGSEIWKLVEEGPVTRAGVLRAAAEVESVLDRDFFRARLSLAIEPEVRYLREMARIDRGPYEPAEVATRLDMDEDEAVRTLEACVEKELLYVMVDGRCAYTVPQFDLFLRRRLP